MRPDREPAGFTDLDLRPELQEALTELGYEEPTPIQRETIPVLLRGHDLLGQAATGTGKTAAFALPVLHRHYRDPAEPAGAAQDPVALVLVPTRELAVQVSQACHRYGRGLGVRVLPVYGGQVISRQLQALARGVDIVVATPGRALDHMRRGSLRLDAVRTVVLDEADEMLDMGFAEDIDAILDATPAQRQTVLFSATIPARIDAIARRHLSDPVRVEMGGAATAAGEPPLVQQKAYLVARAHKPGALGRVLDVEAPTAALVFCRTRESVEQLVETMTGRGYRAEALHGGMGQQQRDRVMHRLRTGAADLVVATDVAARGLDVEQLTHVVNYDLPSAPDAYVHRIGRVGRAGREGVAVSLAEPREHRMLKAIERATGHRVNVSAVPTVAELRARRLDLTRAALRETLVDASGTADAQNMDGADGADGEAADGALDRFRVVVESLTDEFDLMDVALAAVKRAHEAGGGETAPEEEEEIPPVAGKRSERPPRRDARGGEPRGDARGGEARREPRGDRDRGGYTDRAADRDGQARGQPEAPAPGMTRLFVGTGRRAGLRPQDLVGAIANESPLRGRDVGSIEIFDRFSLVEVPADAADSVITALRHTTVKGMKVPVRHDQGAPGGRPG